MLTPKQIADFLSACATEGILKEDVDFSDFSHSHFEAVFQSLAENRKGPELGDSVCIGMKNEKISALFFDKIWDIPGFTDFPRDLCVSSNTEPEQLCLIFSGFLNPGTKYADIEMTLLQRYLPEVNILDQIPGVKRIAEHIGDEFKISPVTIYDDVKVFDSEYTVGSINSIVICIDRLNIVDEKKLSWDKVLEIRKDKKSILEIRKLRHWIDSSFDGKSLSYVTDEMGIRLDNYEFALKKHGINTVLGTASDLLDFRFLPVATATTLAAAFTGGGMWAALAGGGITLGKIGISVSQKLLSLQEIRQGSGSEVAFIHELKNSSK